MASILVTGGAGYVGSVCCRRLLEQGHKVVVIDDLSSGRAAAVPGGASLYILDYGDRAGVSRLLGHARIDAVFHFAAKALIPESVSNPGVFFDVNVSSAIAFLEVLRRFGVKRFVFSSSAAVYGSPQSDFIDEDDPKDPVNSYGESKLMLERVLRWYAAAYGWTVAAFRYFNASGATREAGEDHQPETHIIPLLLDVAAGDRPVFEMYGDDYDTPDGTCVRDYVHVSDIAGAHLLALNIPQRAGMRIYNIGCGKGYSVREVVAAVQQVTGRKIPVRISARRPGDPPALCASPARIERELRWKPLCSDLQNIIRTAWEWKINSRRQRAVYERKMA
ncbi:MAG TPA: UDP-glucose 4-epimerase GalE [Terriglobales bacterium]